MGEFLAVAWRLNPQNRRVAPEDGLYVMHEICHPETGAILAAEHAPVTPEMLAALREVGADELDVYKRL